MFTPNSKAKKLLKTYGNQLYLWRDGAVIEEKKTVKIAKDLTQDVYVYHYYPCEITITARQYETDQNNWCNYRSQSVTVNYVRIMRGHLALHGVKHIEITFGSSSETSASKGIFLNRVSLTDPDDGESEITWIPRMFSGRVDVSPDPTDYGYYSGDKTAQEFVKRQSNVITYDAK